jgi:hypothetical protein
MSNIKTANVAKAKVIYYKDKETYKIIFAFNVHKKEKDNGDIVYMFPTQAKCAYVSGARHCKQIKNVLSRKQSKLCVPIM